MNDARQKILALVDAARAARAPGERRSVIQLAAGDVEFILPMSIAREAAQRAVARAEGDVEVAVDVAPATQARLRLTASSTSVDWYGTEMSRACLEDMAAQFTRGVDLLPRHHGFLASVEWDEVLGRTDRAVLLSGAVAAPADLSEPQFKLDVEGNVDLGNSKAADLVRRLEAGQEIGSSIGGWFRAVTFIDGDDGEVERIIIESVQLDHLAIVRAPANPDSMGIKVLRSAFAPVARTTPVEQPEPVAVEPEPMAARSVPLPEPVADDPAPVEPEHRSTPAEPDQRSDIMETEKILAALADLSAAVRSTNDRVASMEARVAVQPAAEPVIAAAVGETDEQRRIKALEADLVRMKADVARKDAVLYDLVGGARAIAQDGDNGAFFLDDEQGRRDMTTSLVARAKEASRLPTVCAVVERSIDVIAVNPQEVPGGGSAATPAGDRARKARHALPDILRRVCVAADRDGFFNYSANELRGWAVAS